jgi:hypothetical protein
MMTGANVPDGRDLAFALLTARLSELSEKVGGLAARLASEFSVSQPSSPRREFRRLLIRVISSSKEPASARPPQAP